MSDGWVKIHRRLSESDLWLSQPFTRGQAWVDLILLANHKDRTVWIRGIEIKVKRGQVARSIVNLKKRWSWSRGKVLRFISWLKAIHQIEHQKNNVTSLITIINYDMYQGNGIADDTPNGTPNGHQTDTKRVTNKNVKNEKNEKKKKKKIEKEKKATEVPSDFGLDEKMLAWVKQKGYDEKIDVNLETENFITHHQSRGNKFLNHQAAWRNWIIKAVKYARHPDDPLPVPHTKDILDEVVKKEPFSEERKESIRQYARRNGYSVFKQLCYEFNTIEYFMTKDGRKLKNEFFESETSDA